MPDKPTYVSTLYASSSLERSNKEVIIFSLENKIPLYAYIGSLDKHPNLVKLGKRIREHRILKGYSQEGLASDAGVGRSYMGRIERGEQNISIQNLIQIALTLRVEVGDLIPPIKQLKNPHS